MQETRLILAAIRTRLKAQGMTYRDVARALRLSEPSVKRLFSTGRVTLDRLVELSHLLGYSLAELASEAAAEEVRLHTLTAAQEKELVSDEKLLLVAVCVLNQWQIADMVRAYALSEAECIERLVRLDRLRLIDLLPGNRVRLNVARDFDWLPDGPIQRYFEHGGQADFLHARFSAEGEMRCFLHGMLTDEATTKLQAEIRRLRQSFAELLQASLSAPLAMRHGRGLLFATREWELPAFEALRRS